MKQSACSKDCWNVDAARTRKNVHKCDKIPDQQLIDSLFPFDFFEPTWPYLLSM